MGMCWTALLLGIVLAGHRRLREQTSEPDEDEPENQGRDPDVVPSDTHEIHVLVSCERITVRLSISELLLYKATSDRRMPIFGISILIPSQSVY